MSNEEVLVAPINSVDMNGPGQVEAISNAISAGLLGPANSQNEVNTQLENQNTTPRRKNSKHSHKKKLTPAERLARCAITNNRVILDVEPDEKHSTTRRRSRRVRTYNTYEEYLAAKAQNHDPQNPDESDVVSFSEFNMSETDASEFENIQTEEKNLLDLEIFEEIETKNRAIQEEQFEQLSHPHFLCDVTQNRNACYDDISAAIDRGMPGNPLEKEIAEQEEKEQKEHDEDIQRLASMLYPESPLETQLSLNFNSDYIRNDFGLNTALNESAFSVSEINSDVISMSPRSPRGINPKMRNVCHTGTVTLLSVGPDEEKVAAYQDQKENSKLFTHVRRYRTTDKTNELNASLGLPGSISNVKLESKSTYACFTESEERVKDSEDNQLQSALDEENANHVLEGRGMSYSDSNLSSEFFDLTILSDEEKIKFSEDDKLENEIEEERREIQERKALREKQKLDREREEIMRKLDLDRRIMLPDMPPNDITDNGDGTTDVGIQTVRCDIEDLVNRKSSRKARRRRHEAIPYADEALFAIQPRVLLRIETDRNACYDNINDSIDRGMPGNPLEDEFEELEALQEKEKLDDIEYYNSTLYNERALKDELQHSLDSDTLRDEFGKRPEEEVKHDDLFVEEEEEDEYASNSEPEEQPHELAPPTQSFTNSPRLRRRVKKPNLKTVDTQCKLANVEDLDKVLDPQRPFANAVQEPATRNLDNKEEDQQKIIMGQLGEQMNQILTNITQNPENTNDNDEEDNKQENQISPDDANSGLLENETNTRVAAMFSNPNENNEGNEQQKLDDPIGQAFGNLMNPAEDDENENEQPKSEIQPLDDPMGQAFRNLTNQAEDKDSEEQPKPEIQPLDDPMGQALRNLTNPVENKDAEAIHADNEADRIAQTFANECEKQETSPLQDLQLDLLKLTANNNNEQSDISENLPRIQMPSNDIESSGVSPRTKSPRRGNFRNSAYRNGLRQSPSSPSINRLKERAMKLEPITNATNEQLEILIDDIEKERKIMMRERRFKDGLKCNAAIKHVESILSKQQREQNPDEQLEIAFDNETRKKEQELLDKQRLSRRKLKAKHQRELDNLDKQWNSIQTRKNYNKPSAKLIEMKKQYDAMLAAGNPNESEEANKLNQEINRLRQIETGEAHQRMQRDYDSDLLHLQQKQHQDFVLLLESNKVKMDQLKQERAKEKRALDFKKIKFTNNDQIENDDNNLINAQSEKYISDPLGNLFDHSDSGKNGDNDSVEKLNLPPLDTRRPKSLRFAKPDSLD